MARSTKLPSSLETHVRGRTPEVATPLVNDEWLVVTSDELVVLGQAGIRLDLPWIAIESAKWDGAVRTFTLSLVDGQAAVVQTASDDVWLITVAVRERINSSIVHVEYLATEAGGEVRALIRKGARGELSSQILARGPVFDHEQPAIDALERSARAAVGLATS